MCKEYSAFKVPARAQKANGSSVRRIKELEAPALLGRLKNFKQLISKEVFVIK